MIQGVLGLLQLRFELGYLVGHVREALSDFCQRELLPASIRTSSVNRTVRRAAAFDYKVSDFILEVPNFFVVLIQRFFQLQLTLHVGRLKFFTGPGFNVVSHFIVVGCVALFAAPVFPARQYAPEGLLWSCSPGFHPLESLTLAFQDYLRRTLGIIASAPAAAPPAQGPTTPILMKSLFILLS